MKKNLKKIISIVLLTTLFINTMFINSVFATDKLDQTEISESQIRKIKSDIEETYTNDEDKANAFFISIGINERWLNNFTKEYKNEIYRTANSVGMLNEYFVESIDGTTRKITEKEYIIQKNKQKTKDVAARTSRSIDSGVAEETDSYFKKTLIWIGTTNNSGYYAVITIFEWLSPPSMRGVDALFLSATTGTFDSSTSGCAMQYKKTAYWGTNVVTDEIVEEFDENDTNNIIKSSNYIGYKFNLPNDILGSTAIDVSDLAIMLACGYYVQNPELITNFSLFGTYFHRIITISTSVSVDSSLNGNIALSLQSQFRKYTIDDTLTYRPQ